MKKGKDRVSNEPERKIRPALNPEARENQMIHLAVDLAEKQLLEGNSLHRSFLAAHPGARMPEVSGGIVS